MKKTIMAICALLFAFVCAAEQVCVNGVCYLSEEDALAAGVSLADIEAARKEHAAENAAEGTKPADEKPAAAVENAPVAVEKDPAGARVAMGYMNASKMVAFLRDEAAEKELEDHSLLVILLLVLLGGLAANLTPCVLPLVPVNHSASRARTGRLGVRRRSAEWRSARYSRIRGSTWWRPRRSRFWGLRCAECSSSTCRGSVRSASPRPA